jgi:hypothetical protein
MPRKRHGFVMTNKISLLELVFPATGVQAVQYIIVITDLHVQQSHHMNPIKLILYCRYTSNLLRLFSFYNSQPNKAVIIAPYCKLTQNIPNDFVELTFNALVQSPVNTKWA